MIESPEQWFHRRATHYVEAQMLFHLSQVGVFHLLDDSGPCTAETMANELGLVPEVLSTVLDYLQGVDQILERDLDGRYGLTAFGRAVLKRFGRDDGDRKFFNFFDVRVGSYGEVWRNLGALLQGSAQYGQEVRRVGGVAASAVYTVSARMIGSVHQQLERLKAKTVIEIGVSTGLLSLLRQRNPDLNLIGMDRSLDCLSVAQQRANEQGCDGIEWVQGDFFQPKDWMANVGTDSGSLVIMSVHFHELLAAGPQAVIEALHQMGERWPGIRLLVLEQPRLSEDDRNRVSEVEWLYSHSNILIHHLIGNGKILSQEQWNSLFLKAGGVVESCDPLGFLGYNIMVVRLGGLCTT